MAIVYTPKVALISVSPLGTSSVHLDNSRVLWYPPLGSKWRRPSYYLRDLSDAWAASFRACDSSVPPSEGGASYSACNYSHYRDDGVGHSEVAIGQHRAQVSRRGSVGTRACRRDPRQST